MFPFEFILIQLLLCIVIKSKADIISVKTNMRYQTFYESQMARSYMDCMALCVPLGICAGASYNRITTECQLSDVNSEDALDNAEGWTSGLKAVPTTTTTTTSAVPTTTTTLEQTTTIAPTTTVNWNIYPAMFADGVWWNSFWWYQAGSGWPNGETDVLAAEYGSCQSDATYCFGRLPEGLSETGAELLGIDSVGTIYRWAFNASNPTAHAAWRAFHEHEQTESSVIIHSAPWDPIAVAGNQPLRTQDCFMYRTENGVASIMLDDDNCDWYTTLSIGHGMCGSSSGHSGIYGVDLLFDEKGSPSPGYGLTLYFRDNGE